MLFLTVIGILSLASGLNSQCLTSYNVVSGDTLCAIAQKYGCSSWTAIGSASNAAYNLVNAPQTMQVGDTLCIPSASCTGSYTTVIPQGCPGAAAPGTGGCLASYTVQSGDTLCVIAQKYGCSSWTAIASASNAAYNLVNAPTGMQPGEVLCIPSASCTGSYTAVIPQGCPGAAAPAPAPSAACAGTSYTVQAGNTFCQIAELNGCDNWQNIASASGLNNLIATPQNLQVGTVLCLPNSACTFSCSQYYYPTATDTMASISANTNCQQGVLNNYYGNCPIVPGQAMCIPSGCALNNGWQNGVFYCNGVQSATNTGAMCGGTFYCNGNPIAANAMGQYVCNSITYTNTGAVSCPATAVTGTVNCQTYATNHGITLQQLYACNPGLNQANCVLTNGATYTV